MIGESPHALFLIRALIFFLRCVTPGAFLYWSLLILAPITRSIHPGLDLGIFHWKSTSLATWALRLITGNEVWFYFWSQSKTKQYQIVRMRSRHDAVHIY